MSEVCFYAWVISSLMCISNKPNNDETCTMLIGHSQKTGIEFCGSLTCRSWPTVISWVVCFPHHLVMRSVSSGWKHLIYCKSR